jgi:hypothetical protein
MLRCWPPVGRTFSTAARRPNGTLRASAVRSRWTRWSAGGAGLAHNPAGKRPNAEEQAVLREIETDPRMLERRDGSALPSNVGLLGREGPPDINASKWDYQGYGIWESNDESGGEDGKIAVNNSAPPGKPQSATFTSRTTTTTTTRSLTAAASDGGKASSATQELDDLMTSLNSFKLPEGKAEEPVPTTLDAMLGNLQEDMDKQGVRMTQKGVCAACDKPIVGQVITALGKTWHPEHFVCSHCNQELGTQNFFDRDGRAYCEPDYHQLFSPRCAHCQQAILDKCISALDRTWHPEHFVCHDCQRPFGEEGFHEKEDQAFCKDCYFGQFAPKCGGCSEPITENYVSSLGAQWHPQCFVCKECEQPFADGNFFEHDGAPYCETHYHALRGSLCAGCHKPISGRCITAMFRKFHPEHFVCSFCLKQLNKGTFKEQGEKPYCHECFDRLFG